MYTIGTYLLEEYGMERNVNKGLYWLKKSLSSGSTRAGIIIGFHYYQENNFYLASEYFIKSYLLGELVGGINTAYMLRRNEITMEHSAFTIMELLERGIEASEPFALVNYAICLASGFQCEVNWKKADYIISNMLHAKEVVSWWYDLTKNNDPEGHLVIGWLVRNMLIDDPDGFEISERMTLAKDGGWKIPEWMFKMKSISDED